MMIISEIKYLVVDELPNNLEEIFESDNEIIKEHKFIKQGGKFITHIPVPKII